MKFYNIFEREEGKNLMYALREVVRECGLYRELSLSKKAYGRSGDMAAVTAEYEVFNEGTENGYTTGSVHVYSHVYDSCNGYAHTVSVLLQLPEDSETAVKIAEFLDKADFVPKYSKFRLLPIGARPFWAYLDTLPDSQTIGDAFRAN